MSRMVWQRHTPTLKPVRRLKLGRGGGEVKVVTWRQEGPKLKQKGVL